MHSVRTLLILFALATSIGIIACEGDQGPQGPEGPQGPPGEPGISLACTDCHNNSQLIATKQAQWENSVHGMGVHAGYATLSPACAVCHSSQGFLEAAANKDPDGTLPTTASIPESPLSQNCYTCHNIHQEYSSEDWNLTEATPVKFWVGEDTEDLGNANLCINCHQARIPEYLPEPGVDDDVEAEIGSSRYGPHHGSQGVMFTGNSAYEVSGPTPYENSVHTQALGDGACITCHMKEPAVSSTSMVNVAGGHTFRVATVDGDLNTLACAPCHTEEEANALAATARTEIEGLLNELGDKLITVGILDSATRSRSVPGTYTNLEIGAMWNYKYVEEDQSFGVHNFTYAKALLENSIAALE